jgi:hypothetical protein
MMLAFVLRPSSSVQQKRTIERRRLPCGTVAFCDPIVAQLAANKTTQRTMFLGSLIGYAMFVRAPFTNKTYAVPHANALEPAAAWYFSFYLCFVFALCERKNETQCE